MDTAINTAQWPKDRLLAASAPFGAMSLCAALPRIAAASGTPYASQLPDTTYPALSRNAAVPRPGRAKPRQEPRSITPPPEGGDGACINSYGVEGLLGERQMNTSIRNFLKEEDGITALEYGLLAAIVAGVIVVAFKGPLGTFFTSIFTALTGDVTTATT